MDISGNAGGQTWFWGYEDASQLVNGGSIVLSALSSPANVSSLDREGNPQHGFEINYQLELGDA